MKVIVDKTSARQSKSGSRYSAATYLTNVGIPVWVDTKVAIAHNKVMVIDATMVITGSFNFTAAAQSHNAENLLVLDDPEMATPYKANWEGRKSVVVLVPGLLVWLLAFGVAASGWKIEVRYVAADDTGEYLLQAARWLGWLPLAAAFLWLREQVALRRRRQARG